MAERTGTTSTAGPRTSQRFRASWVIAALAVVAVLALAGLAAGSGSWAAAPAPAPTTTTPAAPSASVTPTPAPVESTAPSGPPAQQFQGDDVSGYLVLALAAVVVLGALLLTGRRLRWSRGRRAAQAPSRAVSATPSAEFLPDAVHRALEAVEVPDAREAVVRAWLLLGEAAAAAGTPARPSETAAEYARRLATEHRLPSASLEHLAELYREARFSDHPVQPGQRAEARAELETLRSALSVDARTAAP